MEVYSKQDLSHGKGDDKKHGQAVFRIKRKAVNTQRRDSSHPIDTGAKPIYWIVQNLQKLNSSFNQILFWNFTVALNFDASQRTRDVRHPRVVLQQAD